MKRLLAVLLTAGLLGGVPLAAETQEPIALDKVEKERVRLMLLDVVVVDKQGRTVPDLTLDDFEVISAGAVRPIETLDVNCPGGWAEDPRAVNDPAKRAAPAAQEAERKLVFLLDYQHMNRIQIVDVLEQARRMVKHGTTENEEFMLAALTGGLRIEQPFTSDHDEEWPHLSNL